MSDNGNMNAEKELIVSRAESAQSGKAAKTLPSRCIR